MNKQEYDITMKKLKEDYEKNQKSINRDFAFNNNPYEIYHIIKDHYQIIKIEKIKWTFTFGKYPECVYYGPKLKKDLTPFKSGEKSTMYQSNVKGKLNDN